MAVGTPYRRLVQPKYDLGCELCVDIVTDLDNWITGDETEDEIVQFVEQVRTGLMKYLQLVCLPLS